VYWQKVQLNLAITFRARSLSVWAASKAGLDVHDSNKHRLPNQHCSAGETPQERFQTSAMTMRTAIFVQFGVLPSQMQSGTNTSNHSIRNIRSSFEAITH
jgi:hypothetical protein